MQTGPSPPTRLTDDTRWRINNITGHLSRNALLYFCTQLCRMLNRFSKFSLALRLISKFTINIVDPDLVILQSRRCATFWNTWHLSFTNSDRRSGFIAPSCISWRYRGLVSYFSGHGARSSRCQLLAFFWVEQICKILQRVERDDMMGRFYERTRMIGRNMYGLWSAGCNT